MPNTGEIVWMPAKILPGWWGGTEEREVGVADVLPFIVLSIGVAYVIYVIYESIKLKLWAPIIGTILGGIVPIVTFGPSMFMYLFEAGAFSIFLLLGCLFGLIVSSSSWYVRRRG